MTNIQQTILKFHTTTNEKDQKILLEELLSYKNASDTFSPDVGIHFLTLGTIARYKPDYITGEILAHAVEFLTKLESIEGGPYHSTHGGTSIDLDTNIAIAYFLASQNISLPSLTSLIEKAIENQNFQTKTFGSGLMLMYITSLFYYGEKREALLLQIYNMTPENGTEEALKTIVEHFPIKGSNSKPAITFTPEEETLMDKVFDLAEKRFERLPKEMRELALQVMKQTIRGNPDKQMSLMTLYTKQSLGESAREFSDEVLAETSLANIFYWTAFIIYDDFWDEDDKADPRALPVANLFARHYSTYFTSLFPVEKGFNRFFQDLMDKLDTANNWETVVCRARVEGTTFHIPETLPEYGDYTRKYEPASGHILGSLTLFLRLGYTIDSPEIKHLTEYFKHYLIAMQLNDDAHDWEEDLERGTLSTVVVMILEEFKKTFPNKQTLDLIEDKDLLQEIYWFTVIKKVCTKAINHTTQSRLALHKISIITNPSPLERYIDKPERIARQALDEQKRSVEFLKTYIPVQ